MTLPFASFNRYTPGASGRDLRCSVMSTVVVTATEDRPGTGGSGEHAADRLGHAGGLLGALDLHGPALRDLPPAVADLVHAERLHARADLRPGRDGRREADLVPAVVHAQLEAARA